MLRLHLVNDLFHNGNEVAQVVQGDVAGKDLGFQFGLKLIQLGEQGRVDIGHKNHLSGSVPGIGEKKRGDREMKGRKSNADRIRGLSDEELAEYLYEYFWGRVSASPNRKKKLLDWLRQPAPEEDQV